VNEGRKQEESDVSAMMDLFRTEVKRHALTINDGLQALGADPGSLDRLHAMISAIQAIKGGAQIIDLDRAVAVAQAMKSVFVAAEKGEFSLDEAGLGYLFEGVEILNHMAEAPREEETPWIDLNTEEINAWVNKATFSPAGESPELSLPSNIPSPPVEDAPQEDAEGFLDPAMCDLFRTETQNHVAILNDGLLTLEQNPASADQLDAMMRAAHSLKGAARIMGLDGAAHIAHAMEDFFVAAQKGPIRLDPDKVDILFQGIDMLNRISEHVGEGGSAWLSGHRKEIETVKDVIIAMVDQAPDATDHHAQEPEKPSHPESDKTFETGHDEPHMEDQDKPHQQTGGNFAADPAMLDLFQAEVETHVAVLSDGLLALENNPGATDQLEALMRAAHSIKGGARIVGLDAAVKVAHAMEDCFVAAQKGAVSLGSEQIDILLRIVDILINIAESIHDGETDWVSRHGEEIDHLMVAMTAILHGEAPIPVSPVEEPFVQDPVPIVPIDSESEFSLAKTTDIKPVPKETTETSPALRKSGELDRTVRVTAAKIERLMGQAGEVVVGAGWLPTFSESLLELKRNHLELLTLLDGLQDTIVRKEKHAQAQELVVRAREKTKACTLQLADRLNQFDIFTGATAALSDRIYHEVISVRMRPFSDGVQGFPRLVRDLARDLGKKVRLEIMGKGTEVDRDILEKLDAPLNHLIRNAVDHGIESPEERTAAGKPETGLLRLEASHRSGMLMITVKDDGRGIDLEKLRQKIVQKKMTTQEMATQMTEAELMEFLFLPGFSTAKNVTEISGRGVGLDVVHNMVHEVGGVVRAVSNPGEGLTFHIELPLTLSVVRTFLVEIAGEPYAFPLARIDRCLELLPSDIDIVEDRQYFRFDNNNIALLDIHNVLELETPLENREKLFVVVLSDRLNAYGLAVDKFLGECDLVVRPLDARLGKVPDISSVAVMLDGAPVLIFDVEDLVRSIDNLLAGRRLRKLNQGPEAIEAQKQKRILVVDDSFTVREMERKLLESKGYQVDTAVDGVDGWNAVRTGSYDMVISDVDMPRMNGIEFVNQIKRHAELKSIPVIIVSYKDKEEDRLAGLQAGANYYLTKSSFQDDSFIRAAVNLIGEA
jgi:two-component system, chemotaxis family, sensor histidine kinase and response regulator WspE